MMVMNSPLAAASPSSPVGTGASTEPPFHTVDSDPEVEIRTPTTSLVMSSAVSPCAAPSAQDALRLKFHRANALVSSVLNKFYNGSSRAVDPFVIRCLQEEETKLFSLQCFIEQGPAENSRERKESAAISSAAQTTNAQMSLLTRLFGFCGGYVGGPGSIMRQWDAISSHDAGLEDALIEYISIVDRILPGWDRPLPHEYPIAHQDKFWKDDVGVDQCQSCGSSFSTVQCRRHHCRMCLDIFCATCCAEFIDMALCPGAPIRSQRVCSQCYEDAEKDRSLLEVRRVIRENHELEQRIKEITASTEAQISVKKREEAKLRLEAQQCGCDMNEIDAEIARQRGSPIPFEPKVPAPHKFPPRETADANEQLALAHRRLLMSLKGTQCRAKKVVEKMDVGLRVLREAICFGSTSTWNVILRHTGPLLTLREIRALSVVSHTMRRGLERNKCEARCVLAQDLPNPQWRAFLWEAQWLKNDETKQYIADLAEAIRTRIESSDSESDREDDLYDEQGNAVESPPQAVATVQARVTCHALLGVHIAPLRRSVWKTVYEFILARCDDYTSASSSGEFDAQIQGDVSRTFGVSSLRRRTPQPKTNAAGHRKAYQRAGASTLETPLALRKTALTNVLRAFASVNSEIGYCQGMDHVAAFLLSVVDWNESDAFWMLTSLVVSPQFELDQLYGPGLPHLTMRVYQLERLLDVHLPELHAHLKEMEFPVSMITTTWFMTLFTNMDALSYDLVLRVLDGFFVSGWKFIFRVALALMEALQHHMLASTFEEMPQVLYDIHTIAPQFARAETEIVLESVRKFKVTNSQLLTLALEFEQSGGSNVGSSRTNGSIVASARTVINASIVKAEAVNANGAATEGSARAASPTSVTQVNGQTNGHALDSNGNGRASPAKHRASSPAVILGASSLLDISTANEQPNSPPKSPSSRRASRRSRNSSSGSISLESEYGRKSPDKTRAASPAAFVAPPQHFTPQAPYGLATPLNANYFF